MEEFDIAKKTKYKFITRRCQKTILLLKNNEPIKKTTRTTKMRNKQVKIQAIKKSFLFTGVNKLLK